MSKQAPYNPNKFRSGISSEILLFTHTTFLNRELCETDERPHDKPASSQEEQLEKACWSGLLTEILPELFYRKNSDTTFVWEISHALEFICINSGSFPGPVEKEFSVNPWLFLQLFSLSN